MPIQIGDRSHEFSDPTGLLSDCHRRIEMFLRSLQSVAAIIDRPLTENARTALESSLRYFREAAPKHTADEEESLFPRLRQIKQPEVQSAIESLEPLERDHFLAGKLHGRIEDLGQNCLATGSLSAEEAHQFQESVASLASIYEQHIRVEDELVFPVAQRMLPSSEKGIIAREMAARRNVKTAFDSQIRDVSA